MTVRLCKQSDRGFKTQRIDVSLGMFMTLGDVFKDI